MQNKANVLILGYGEMGHAMQYLLSSRHNLYIWEKYPKDGFKSVELEQAVPDADFIIFCLPVVPHREVLRRIAPLLKKDSICLSIAKGLDENGESAAHVFSDVLDDKHKYALIYGPMISEEIRAGHYAFAQIGSNSAEVASRAIDLFAKTRLYMDHTYDVEGITWSVILKNVYAILFGVTDELALGDNVRGFITVQSIRELETIVLKMGGIGGVTCNMAGLGDLIATATSENSHHHALGRSLARGEWQQIDGEGVHTLAMVEKYKIFNEDEFPLYKMIHTIIKSPVRIEVRLDNYIASFYQ